MAVRFKRSYRDRKQAVARRKKTVIKVILIVFSFQILFTLFLSTIKIDTISMEPSLKKGSVLIYSPLVYGVNIKTFNGSLPQLNAPQRGDLVVLTPPFVKEKKGFSHLIWSVLKFLSFGKINIEAIDSDQWNNKHLVKRIIAIPGDTVKMSEFTALIKLPDSDYFLGEFEVIDSAYDVNLGQLPAGWSDSLPFSGNMDPITLEENQFFVLGDNRMESSDSTSWGVLKRNLIEGKVLLTYWPLKRFKVFK